MKVSIRSKWALASTVYFAVNYSDNVIPLKTASKALGISEKYLEQLVIPLKKSGLLESIRGVQGGYRLKKHPKEITVYEVLGSIEPIEFSDEVTSEDKGEDKILFNVTDEFWSQLNSYVIKKLSEKTLEDFRDEYSNKSDEGFMYYI
ncbi:RrF2 family transcriptional regulator [Natranaerobius trueperi]|uniref:Transcriptional regulator n=1 Tax=Natranaerobius trueperi TaxID=759412 RepID=A0A226BXU3_9FIRM|nr:Rrf2 family transcriptional regulator [Natranaerobius trueperi]OWZ83602.1 transcriptional regulator [Natranaerobius trueperi]